MKVEQLYTNCLAEAAYFIESEGEIAIIDPLRETQPYLEMVAKANGKLKYIFETHFHADFVSGHIDLAKATEAKIIYGPNAQTSYHIYNAKDEEVFELGKVQIKVLHTPGHTLESSTYLLIDENGKNHAIFTGDTLFLGDVGRPDLAIKSDISKEDLAGMLYDSLRNKIMTLTDDVIIYPGHGAGSSCGKNMSKETVGTLGEQKQTNYALREDMSKEEFIKEVTTGILPPPQYFAKNAMMNKTGYENVDEVIKKGLKELSLEQFVQEMQNEALVLDVRTAQTFAKGFIPQSINIGLDGMYAIWVGTLIKNVSQRILIVAEEGQEEEAILRLARVGYDNVIGYLEGGFQTWTNANKKMDSILSISAEEFADKVNKEKISVLDVRKPSEYEAEHIIDAQNFPLDFINGHLEDLDKKQTYYVHCAGGYRSMIASSILKAKGYKEIIDIAGGFKKITETNAPKTTYVCPSTLKEA